MKKSIRLIKLNVLNELFLETQEFFSADEAEEIIFPLIKENIKKKSKQNIRRNVLEYTRMGCQFGLLEKIGKNKYRKTPKGNKLYEALKQNDKDSIGEIYEGTFYTHEYIAPIIDFVKEAPRSEEEINNKFQNPTSNKYALDWCEEAHIIEKKPTLNKYDYIGRKKRKVSIDEFWKSLVDNYEKLSKSEFLGVKRVVKITELRDLVTLDLRPMKNEDFDNLLEELILSRKYLGKIELMGAPYPVLRKEEKKGRSITPINGKSYIYIHIFLGR